MVSIQKLILCTVFLLWAASGLQAQEVNWLSFDALQDSLRAHPKPVLIFIHTDWCKYCALQDHNTFGKTKVLKQLNQEYYAVRLNAETKESITFLNRSYQGGTDRYHELAQFLGRSEGQLSFPTTLLFSRHLQLQHRLTGFVSATDLQALL